MNGLLLYLEHLAQCLAHSCCSGNCEAGRKVRAGLGRKKWVLHLVQGTPLNCK